MTTALTEVKIHRSEFKGKKRVCKHHRKKPQETGFGKPIESLIIPQ